MACWGGVAQHMNSQNCFPLGLLGVDEHAVTHDPSVIHYDVKTAKGIDGQLHHLPC